MIGTPAYGGMVHLDYLNSISDYYRSGLPFAISAIGNESLITRARNAILSRFYEDRAYSHLLFLDADVHLSAAGLKQLIEHDVDVVGAPVALKGFNERGERVFNIGRTLGERGGLHEVERIGTAALLLSRAAVETLVEEAKQSGAVYDRPLSRGASSPEKHFDVFRVGVVDGDYLSEDFWICHRLRQFKYRVFVDPQIVTRHQGITEF